MMKDCLAIWVIVVGCICFTACDDLQEIGDIDDVAIEAEYALPLLDTKLSISQLFEDSEDSNSFLDIDQDGNMTIFYDTEGPAMAFNDLASFPSSIPFTVTPEGYKVNITDGLAFQPTKIKLKSGSISFDISSSMQSNVDVMLMIPELTYEGTMFTKSAQLVHDGSQQTMVMEVEPTDIGDYSLDISANNEFTVMYEATDANGSVTLDQATGTLTNLDYEVLEGTWTNEVFNLPQETIELGLYKNWDSGTLTFADPKVRLDVNTNVGFPSTFTFGALTGTTLDQQTIAMTGPIIGADNTLDFPSSTEVGDSKTTSIYIDDTNSNIADFFTSEMSSVDLDLSMQTNPGSGSNVGFITDQAAFTSHLFVELPVFGTAQDFTLSNDFEADLGDIENIKEAEINIIIDNGLPVSLGLQLNFIDQSGNIFESLFADGDAIIESAIIDGNGDVTASTSQTITQDLDEVRATNIFNNTKRVEVKGVVSTANNGGTPVRINANHEMDIKVSGVVRLKQ